MLARRLLLAAALVLGTIGGANYLHRLRDVVPVVVATADIPAHTPLTADKLAVRQVNRDAAATMAGDAVDNMADAVGLVSRMDIPAGEVIRRAPWLVSATPDGADPALPRYQIPDGMRLAGLRVDGPGAVAGWVSPGDRVDVIFTDSGRGTGSAYARTILRGVEVFSVGRKDQDSALPAIDGGLDLTLLVTPEEAQVLALAKRTGGAVDLSIAPPAAATGPVPAAVLQPPPAGPPDRPPADPVSADSDAGR